MAPLGHHVGKWGVVALCCGLGSARSLCLPGEEGEGVRRLPGVACELH